MFRRVSELLRVSAITAMIGILMVSPVMADDFSTITDSADNIFSTGQTVEVDGPMFGGFAAGYKVRYEDVVSEDSVALAGYDISTAECDFGASAYAAGCFVTMEDTDVKGNIIVAGKTVCVSDSTSHAVVIAAKDIEYTGKAKAATLTGNNVYFDGEIDGDVTITADEVIIGENAVVSGELKVYAPSNPDVPADAAIDSYYYEEAGNANREDSVASKVPTFAVKALGKAKSFAYWSFAMILVAVLLRALFGNVLLRAKELFFEKKASVFGFGALCWFLVPIACLILFITCIGIPVSVFTMMIYVFLLCIGVPFCAAALADVVFPKMNVYVSTILCVLILEFVKIIPFIGGLVAIAADMFLLGIVVYAFVGRNKK